MVNYIDLPRIQILNETLPGLWSSVWILKFFEITPLSTETLTWLNTLWTVTLYTSLLGLFTNISILINFAISLYAFAGLNSLSQLEHQEIMLCFASLILGLSSCGHKFSIDSVARKYIFKKPYETTPCGLYFWPIKLVRTLLAMLLFAAGCTKLYGSGLEWIFSDNLSYQLKLQSLNLGYKASPYPKLMIWLSQQKILCQGLAFFTIAFELLYPLAIFKRTFALILVPLSLIGLLGFKYFLGPNFAYLIKISIIFWTPWDYLLSTLHLRVKSIAQTISKKIKGQHC